MLQGRRLLGEHPDEDEFQPFFFQPANRIAGLVEKSAENGGVYPAPVGPVHCLLEEVVFLGNNPFPYLRWTIAAEETSGQSRVATGRLSFFDNDYSGSTLFRRLHSRSKARPATSDYRQFGIDGPAGSRISG
jgi:hypothetical protein